MTADRLGFDWIYRTYHRTLLESEPVEVGEWHSMNVAGNPQLVTMEVPFVSFTYGVPQKVHALQEDVRPNLPWAEDHFQERVSGEPMNPAPSHHWWPWAHGQHHDENEVFSHTYPERFWPKQAGEDKVTSYLPLRGIRYPYGDLMDVVNQLRRNIYTRQAVLPVFFPEDTGNVANVRVPCSLSYHFLYRKNALHVSYPMRSCDFVRHFRDDVYMACRLLQWVCTQINAAVPPNQPPVDYIVPGNLHMNIGSLHAMEGDRWKMTEEAKEWQAAGA